MAVHGAPSSIASGRVQTAGATAVKIVDARATRSKLFLRLQSSALVGIGPSSITSGSGGAYYHNATVIELETAAEVWCIHLDGAAAVEQQEVRFLELYD
jgi:hypothetical protein